MTWKSATKQFVSFRRSRGNPAPDEINCRCLSNDNHGVRRRGGGDGSKLFQTKLWRFYGISTGCKPPKPKVLLLQIFCRFRLPSTVFLTPPPHIPSGSRRRGSSADGIGGSDVFIAGLIRAGANSQPSMNSTYWKEMSTFGSGPV